MTRLSISVTPAELAGGERAEDRVITTTRSVEHVMARNQVPERPSTAYLRLLILTLVADRTTPIEMQGQCVNLMRAINANDLSAVTALVRRLERLADMDGLTLPTTGPSIIVPRLTGGSRAYGALHDAWGSTTRAEASHQLPRRLMTSKNPPDPAVLQLVVDQILR